MAIIAGKVFLRTSLGPTPAGSSGPTGWGQKKQLEDEAPHSTASLRGPEVKRLLPSCIPGTLAGRAAQWGLLPGGKAALHGFGRVGRRGVCAVRGGGRGPVGWPQWRRPAAREGTGRLALATLTVISVVNWWAEDRNTNSLPTAIACFSS